MSPGVRVLTRPVLVNYEALRCAYLRYMRSTAGFWRASSTAEYVLDGNRDSDPRATSVRTVKKLRQEAAILLATLICWKYSAIVSPAGRIAMQPTK